MACTRGRNPSTLRIEKADDTSTTQPGVIRRVHRKHVSGELGPREALGHHPAAQGERGVHVLGEPGVVERLAGLVVTHHQPGIMTVGQGDGMHRAELPNLGEEREGVVPIGSCPTRRAPPRRGHVVDRRDLFVMDEPRAQNPQPRDLVALGPEVRLLLNDEIAVRKRRLEPVADAVDDADRGTVDLEDPGDRALRREPRAQDHVVDDRVGVVALPASAGRQGAEAHLGRQQLLESIGILCRHGSGEPLTEVSGHCLSSLRLRRVVSS